MPCRITPPVDGYIVMTLQLAFFQDFHARYYHPSNARIWFYGDDPPEERLRILSTFLDEFDAREVLWRHATCSWPMVRRAMAELHYMRRVHPTSHRAASQVDSHVERQPLFSEPRRVQEHYAAGEDSGEDAGKVCGASYCCAHVCSL